MSFARIIGGPAVVVAFVVNSALAVAATGQLELRIVDDATGQPLTARVHLRDARGRGRRVKGQPALGDHFVVNGIVVLKLPTGRFSFRIERGLEYLDQTGYFIIEDHALDNKTIRLKRFVDMAKLGWWSGDLLVQRRPQEIETLMQAEDLAVAHVARNHPDLSRVLVPVGNDNDDGPSAGLPTAVDGREGGPLAAHGAIPTEKLLDRAAESTGWWIREYRQETGIYLTALAADAWDLPMWLASGRLDAVAIMAPTDAEFKPATRLESYPRDASTYPGERGHHRWREHIYHQILEAGFRLPPVAATHSGATELPPGSVRIYAKLPGDFQVDQWWESLRAGQLFVTGGPILLASINGYPAGHVFDVPAGGSIELKIELTLHTRQKVRYLEILKNGEVHREIRLDDWAKANGRIEPITFQESGWLAIRAVTTDSQDYVYGTTAPFYVDGGGQRRVSRTAVKFFQSWGKQRLQQVRDGGSSAAVRFHAHSVDYWAAALTQATVD